MALQPAGDAHSGRTVGHYRILEMIGHGGMGEVYRAEDQRLQRDVAVKVLPQRLARDDVASRRFVREARIASTVVHPYIATVFDVVREDDDLYLVMELIEGRPLSQVLRRDEVPREDRLRWALEITEALCAIHHKGLVHRDVKPGNVMVTPEGHVKVMDFGLARQSTADSDPTMLTTEAGITQDGIVVGTIVYMSPEQLRTQPTDRRSDLFSLGILLYELISGIHPFKKETAAESASAILNEQPGGGLDPQSLTETGPIRNVVMRLLEKQPERRYQSSDEVLAELRAIMSPGGIPAVLARRRARAVWVALAATAAVLVVTAWGLWWVTRPPVPLEPRVVIALVPFVDRTGEENGQVLAGMAADFLSIDLDASRLVRSVGPRETTPLLGEMAPDADPAEIARRIGRGASIDYVVVGTLYREDDAYLASIALTPARSGLPELPELRGRGITVVELTENLGSVLRRSLPGVSKLNAWRDGRTPVADLTSESGLATLFYEKGLLAQREYKLNAAAENFEKAIDADAGFALAHAKLAEVLHGVGYGRRAREAAERAVQLVPDGQTLAEQKLALMVRATRAEVFSRTTEAVELTNRLVSDYPGEPPILQKNAAALVVAGEYDPALARMDWALEVDPLNASVQLQRADVLLRSYAFEDAMTALDETERLFELIESTVGVARTAYLRGQALILKERFAEAGAELTRALGLFEQSGNELLAARTLQELAHVSLYTGNSAEAERVLDRTALLAREAGDLGLECRALTRRGAQRYLAGDYGAAEPLLREAVDRARQLENDHLLISPLYNLGGLLAYIGRREEARGELTSAVEVARRLERKRMEINALRQLSDIEYQLGDLDSAVASLEAMLEESRESDELRRGAAWTLLVLAEIRDRRGRLKRALEATDGAIEIARELSLTEVLGYALQRRSEVLSALGQFEAARQALDEASRIAGSPETDLQDLAARCLLARGILHGFDGRWDEALKHADLALDHPGAGAPAVSVAAHTLACQALIEIGDVNAAVGRCGAATENAAAPIAEIVAARSFLSVALLRLEKTESALAEATEAIEQADAMKLLLPTARAAVTLLGASPDARLETSIRQRGLDALDEYVRSAPEDSLDSLRVRKDVQRLESALKSST